MLTLMLAFTLGAYDSIGPLPEPPTEEPVEVSAPEEIQEELPEDAVPMEDVLPAPVSPDDADRMRQLILDNADMVITILREAGLLPEPAVPEKPVSEEPVIVEEEKSPAYVYLYTMPGCPPCEQMLADMRSYELGRPFELILPPYPSQDRLGQLIQRYPYTQIVRDGRVIRTFVGYVPYETLVDNL